MFPKASRVTHAWRLEESELEGARLFLLLFLFYQDATSNSPRKSRNFSGALIYWNRPQHLAGVEISRHVSQRRIL
jgi:hypothetical protein